MFVEHIIIPYTDHKGVALEIKTEEFKRGPGIWRFNNSLLSDKTFIDFTNSLIDNFLIVNSHKDPSMLWELLKVEIKSQTIQYCTSKNQNIFSETRVIINEIKKGK